MCTMCYVAHLLNTFLGRALVLSGVDRVSPSRTRDGAASTNATSRRKDRSAELRPRFQENEAVEPNFPTQPRITESEN